MTFVLLADSLFMMGMDIWLMPKKPTVVALSSGMAGNVAVSAGRGGVVDTALFISALNCNIIHIVYFYHNSTRYLIHMVKKKSIGYMILGRSNILESIYSYILLSFVAFANSL